MKIYQPNTDKDYYLFMCPACKTPHAFTKAGWGFNGNFENPTADSNSLGVGERPEWCHSYMRNGKLEFCSDSAHEMAGQTVEIPEWDSAYNAPEEEEDDDEIDWRDPSDGFHMDMGDMY